MNTETTNAKTDEIDRLREIQEEVEELVGEAMACIRAAGGSTAQADAYWKPHIIGAIRNDHEYLGGSMVTMQDTIEELESHDEE